MLMKKSEQPVEFVEMTVKLLTNKRRDELGEKLHNYLKGMQEYIDNKVVLNLDGPKTVQLWFDADVNMTAKHDIHNIVVDFIS